jgi:hypothetical protein
VNPLASDIEFLVAIKPKERSESRPLRQLHLGVVKGCAEKLLLGSSRTTQDVYRLSEQELGGAIKCELEEESLEIDCGAIARDLGEEMLDVRLERIEVGYLAFGEAWTYKGL